MNFDRKWYVAPGVPIIQKDFFDKRVSLLNEVSPLMIDCVKQLGPDNPELMPITDLRVAGISESYERYKPTGLQMERKMLEEFVLAGAILHESLSIRNPQEKVELSPLGIRLMTKERAERFSRDYLAMSMGFPNYALAETQTVNSLYVEALKVAARRVISDIRCKVGDDKIAILFSSCKGSQTGYDLLVGQERELRKQRLLAS